MSEKKAGVNWPHWRRMDEWSMREAVCLLLRVTPGSWFGDYLETGKSRSHEFSSAQNELYQRGKELRDLIWASHHQRKLNSGGYMLATSPEAMPPGKWVAWARAKGLEIPEEVDDLDAADLPEAAPAELDDPDQLSSRELGTLYKLVLGMAVSGYKYKISDKKSGAPGAIEKDLQSVGLSVGHDTVLKWLKLAAERLTYKDR